MNKIDELNKLFDNKDKIFNPESKDLEMVHRHGAKAITNLNRKYTPVQIKILEERAKLLSACRQLQERLRFFELGIKYRKKYLIAFWGLATFLGWYFGPEITDFLGSLNLSARVIGGTLAGMQACLFFHLYDLGRVYSNVAQYDFFEEEQEAVANLKPTTYDEGRWLTSKEIATELELIMSPITLGRLLSEEGFKRRRHRDGVKYFVRSSQLSKVKNDFIIKNKA